MMEQAAISERELALSAHTRRKAFHKGIAAKAAALRAPAVAQPIEPAAADDALVVALEAVLVAPPPTKKNWFEIIGVGPERVTVAAVQAATCDHFGITHTDLISDRRNPCVVIPRHVGMFLSKEMTTNSLVQIGRKFGLKDHTSVLYAVRKIYRLMLRGDAVVIEAITKIKAALDLGEKTNACAE